MVATTALAATGAPPAQAVTYSKPEWLPLRSAVGGGELRVGCTYKSPYAPENICNDPVTGAAEYHPYWALDLAVNQGGAPVFSAGTGQAEVSPLPSSYGYGNHVVVDHGPYGRTLYAHLASISVASGAQVTESSQLGTVGDTGDTGGADHPHFEYNDTVGGWGRSGSPNDPGQLKACHGSTLVTHPAVR